LVAILMAGFVMTYATELIQNPTFAWDHIFDKYILSLWILTNSFGHLVSVLLVIGILFAFYKGIITMYTDGKTSIKKIEEALNPQLPELKIIYESEVSKKTPPPVIEPIQLQPIVHESVPHLSVDDIKEIVRVQFHELQQDHMNEPPPPRTRARARSRY